MTGDIKFEVLKKVADFKFKYKDLGAISKVDTISPPSVFIGSKLKYPLMNVGILSPVEKDENAWLYDDAKTWANDGFSVEEVLDLRNSLLNSRVRTTAACARIENRLTGIAQEIAIASNPVDLEIELKSKMDFSRNKDRVLTPHGMNAPLKKAKIVCNIKIERSVDKMINDDVKASEALDYLYQMNINEYSLSKILSVGVLGLKKNKRFVPTRWSITATDDTLGKKLISKIKDYRLIDDFQLFYGEFLGNQYIILLFPEVWSYELFELYSPGSSWNPSTEMKASTDFEDYFGRKEYAFATAGGYYASRFPILEYLAGLRRQASILVIRIETPSYWAALGVWVVRESVRKALKNFMKFKSKEELISSAKKIGKIKFNFDYSGIIDRSKLLKTQKTQMNLKKWI